MGESSPVFTDIHCHILPGVDDGSPDIDTSLKMLEYEQNEGVGRIYLTPHYVYKRNRYRYSGLDEIFEEFKEICSGYFPDIELHLGNEILYEPGIPERLKAGKIHTMGEGRFILTEFYTSVTLKEMLKALREYTDCGYKVIIAHVERYGRLYGDTDAIGELLRYGALLQCNTQSILSGALDMEGRWARKLMREDYISFLATDAHDTDKRRPVYRKALEWVKTKCSEQTALRILHPVI